MFGSRLRRVIMLTYSSLRMTYGFILGLHGTWTKRGPKSWPNLIRGDYSMCSMCRISKLSTVHPKPLFQATYSVPCEGSGICLDTFFPARVQRNSFGYFLVVAPSISG